MKALALALCASCIPVAAETPDTGDEVTYTRAELAQMERELRGIIKQREEAAFQAGRADMKQRCPSLI